MQLRVRDPRAGRPLRRDRQGQRQRHHRRHHRDHRRRRRGREAERGMVEQDGNQVSVVAPAQRARLLRRRAVVHRARSSLPDRQQRRRSRPAAPTSRSTARIGYGQIKSGSGDCSLDDVRRPAARRDRLRRHRRRPGRRRAARQERLRRRQRRRRPTDAPRCPPARGDVEIGTTSGPVGRQDRLRRPGDRPTPATGVSMSTGSGDLVIGTATRGKVTAKSASGDVQIGIPAGVPVWTDLTTVSGAIHSNLQGPASPSPAPTTSSCGPRRSAATSSSSKSEPATTTTGDHHERASSTTTRSSPTTSSTSASPAPPSLTSDRQPPPPDGPSASHRRSPTASTREPPADRTDPPETSGRVSAFRRRRFGGSADVGAVEVLERPRRRRAALALVARAVLRRAVRVLARARTAGRSRTGRSSCPGTA